jgi:phthiocerol/phenolphthiocerol synthesis type-I polyketide synthase E
VMNEAEAEERIKGRGLSLAAVNGPRQVVISGETGAIEWLIEELVKEGRRSKKLKTKQAFHSAMMDEVAARFVEEVARVKLRRGEIDCISNVTGKSARVEEMTDARYWGRQLRECVRFGNGIEELMKRPGMVLLEVGPGSTLSKLARQRAERRTDQVIISTMRDRTESCNDSEYLITAIGKLWMVGAEIDWSRYYERERRVRVELPTYPFERQRYWIEARTGAEEIGGIETGDEIEAAQTARIEASAGTIGWLASLHSRPILPSAYVAPGNDRERAMAVIWQAALGVDRVGVNDNFFELGGDSLTAIQVITQLREEFNLDIPVASLYERLTIKSLGALISSLTGEEGSASQHESTAAGRDERVLQRKRFQEEQLLKRRSGQTEPSEVCADTVQGS